MIATKSEAHSATLSAFSLPIGLGPTVADAATAEAAVVQQFEREVNRLAWFYCGGDLQLRDDLVQEGMIGLVRAHRCFNPACGVKFSTYADRHIRGRMRNFIRSESYHNCCVSWAEYRGADDANEEPDAETPRITAQEALEAVTQLLVAVDVEFTRRSFVQAMTGFTRKQRLILSLRFEVGLTVSEIADQLDVSAARVSQVVSEGVAKLRSTFIPAQISASGQNGIGVRAPAMPQKTAQTGGPNMGPRS